MKLIALFFCILTGLSLTRAISQPLPQVMPELAGMSSSQLAKADLLIEQAIVDSVTPGAVLIVLRGNVVVHRKSYGWMQNNPKTRPMTPETIFDLASITKPVATATAIMKLVEDGQIRLTDPVSDYLPEYKYFGGGLLPLNEQPQIIHLLTHTAGLPPYAPIEFLMEHYSEVSADSLMTFLCSLPHHATPGTIFTYSCPSYITLHQIVEKVTETDFATWTRQHLFRPIGMNDTFFMPDYNLWNRIAPTAFRDEEGVFTGIVYDPLAREIMKGVSGNAGLFSTADDLALFAAMMLNDGIINGKRLLSPAAVRRLTTVPDDVAFSGRSPGWDLASSFASNQGDLFGKRAYGHTGYTGTSMVMDPDTGVAIILLTNRVFPNDLTDAKDLRAKVANVVAASVTGPPKLWD